MRTMATDYKRKWENSWPQKPGCYFFWKEKEDTGQEDHRGRYWEGASYSFDGVYHYLMNYAQLSSWIYLHL